MDLISSFKMVQIENPFDCWSLPLVRNLFEKMITLKFSGYGKKYTDGIIPVDTSDWIASHYLVCRGEDQNLEPIMGFRSVSLERYRKHFLQFPPLSIAKQVGSLCHVRELQKLVARFQGQPEKLSYTGAFTVSPQLRVDRALVAELSQLMVLIHYLFHKDLGPGHEIITAAVVRFNVDHLLSQYGFTPLINSSVEGAGLMPFPHLAGESIRFMQGQAFNEKMIAAASVYASWWEGRLVITKDGLNSNRVRLPEAA